MSLATETADMLDALHEKGDHEVKEEIKPVTNKLLDSPQVMARSILCSHLVFIQLL